MRKLAFLFVMAVCLVGCGSDNEPAPPTNNNSSNSSNSSNTNKPIEQPDNNTQVPTQPTDPEPEPIKNITVNLVNNSSLYSYTFRISGNDYIVYKNSYKTLTLENKKHSASVQNNDGMPTRGIYKGIKYTKDLWYNDYIPDNHSFYTHEKAPIIIRNRTDDQLKVIINGGDYIAPFLVNAGANHTIDVDLGYYNVQLLEMDYILFQDKYEYDIDLTESETLAGLLTISE